MTEYIKYWPFSLELRWKMYQYCFNTNTYFRLSLGFVLVEVIKEYIAGTEMPATNDSCDYNGIY